MFSGLRFYHFYFEEGWSRCRGRLKSAQQDGEDDASFVDAWTNAWKDWVGDDQARSHRHDCLRSSLGDTLQSRCSVASTIPPLQFPCDSAAEIALL